MTSLTRISPARSEASPHSATSSPELSAHELALAYGQRTVVNGLNLTVPAGGFTVIIGPNGCGKSTLLRALSRMLRPTSGSVTLGDTDLAKIRTKQVARRIGTLAQAPATPTAITVADLVARGRNPYQSLLQQWSTTDQVAVERALAEVEMTEQSERLVEELSGGQRQRAWIAMALAQETPILLLDEPTTYLDISHQIDVLDLCSRLHTDGRTLVAVLHDLNLAARYATHIVAMRDGSIVAEGTPSEIVTAELLREVFDLDALVLPDPETGRPLIVPRDRRRQTSEPPAMYPDLPTTPPPTPSVHEPDLVTEQETA